VTSATDARVAGAGLVDKRPVPARLVESGLLPVLPVLTADRNESAFRGGARFSSRWRDRRGSPIISRQERPERVGPSRAAARNRLHSQRRGRSACRCRFFRSVCARPEPSTLCPVARLTRAEMLSWGSAGCNIRGPSSSSGGSDVAPSGLDEGEESGDVLRFPGLTPRAVRSRPSRASGTPHAVDSIAFEDNDTGMRPGTEGFSRQ
jgi:hypothetical protein